MRVRSEDLRAYAERDWEAVERSKAQYWVDAKRRMTTLEAFRIADDMRRHVELLRPDWPTPEERAEDLATHARVSAMLRSVRS